MRILHPQNGKWRELSPGDPTARRLWPRPWLATWKTNTPTGGIQTGWGARPGSATGHVVGIPQDRYPAAHRGLSYGFGRPARCWTGTVATRQGPRPATALPDRAGGHRPTRLRSKGGCRRHACCCTTNRSFSRRPLRRRPAAAGRHRRETHQDAARLLNGVSRDRHPQWARSTGPSRHHWLETGHPLLGHQHRLRRTAPERLYRRGNEEPASDRPDTPTSHLGPVRPTRNPGDPGERRTLPRPRPPPPPGDRHPPPKTPHRGPPGLRARPLTSSRMPKGGDFNLRRLGFLFTQIAERLSVSVLYPLRRRFCVSAGPAATMMFLAALISRSCRVPVGDHDQCRVRGDRLRAGARNDCTFGAWVPAVDHRNWRPPAQLCIRAGCGNLPNRRLMDFASFRCGPCSSAARSSTAITSKHCTMSVLVLYRREVASGVAHTGVLTRNLDLLLGPVFRVFLAASKGGAEWRFRRVRGAHLCVGLAIHSPVDKDREVLQPRSIPTICRCRAAVRWVSLRRRRSEPTPIRIAGYDDHGGVDGGHVDIRARPLDLDWYGGWRSTGRRFSSRNPRGNPSVRAGGRPLAI